MIFLYGKYCPVQYIEKEYATNIYNMNGLYIDNYTYEINKDNRTASVSFDVYNSSYIYGSVETYDEKGHLKDVVLIKRDEFWQYEYERCIVG